MKKFLQMYTAMVLSGLFSLNVNAQNCPDGRLPVFNNCPLNINLKTLGTCRTVKWVEPTATDNCSTPTVEITSFPTTGLKNGSCFPLGTTSITYKATNAYGKSQTCRFAVTINSTTIPCEADETPPTISCPANISLTTSGTCAVANWATPTATDNCSGPVIVEQIEGPERGSCFNIGTTKVTYKATDASGNEAVCSSFNIVVTYVDPCLTDAVPPTIKNCPANISVNTGGNCGNPTWIPPTTTDNCTTPSLNYITAPWSGIKNGECFPVGEHTVTYTATDDKGNKSNCTFKINIISTCNQISNPGSIGDNQTICSPATFQPINEQFPASGGSGNTEYMWMYSTTTPIFDATTWEQVPNSGNTKDLSTFPTFTGKAYVVRCTRSVGCNLFLETNVVTLNKVCFTANSGAIQSLSANIINTSNIQLMWTTKGETIASKYAIEQSSDGQYFFEIGTVNSQVKAESIYQFTHSEPKMGHSFYRIKHLKHDGKVDYSELKKVTLFNNNNGAFAYPNPVDETLFLEVLNVENTEGVINIYDRIGKLVKTENFNKQQSRYEIDATTLPSGNYIVKITLKDGSHKTVKISKI